MYFSKIRVDPNDEAIMYVLGIELHVSRDSGKTFKNDGAPGVHADHHAMWINPGEQPPHAPGGRWRRVRVL
jgi:hypothetical protein